jgi:hypothetical protein
MHMTKFTRLAAIAAAATLFATPAVAAPVSASPKAQASARIVRPLTLTATRNLNFGTIVVGAIPGTQTVTVSQAGALTCGASGLTCSGTVASAQYNVTGTNNMRVFITATGSNLTNTTSGGSETLAFAPSAPAFVDLTNSGAPGNNFTVGGSIQIATTTVDGLYSGDIEVTVDY